MKRIRLRAIRQECPVVVDVPEAITNVNQSKNINLTYFGDVDDPYVVVKLKKKVSEGNYTDTAYNIVSGNLDLGEDEGTQSLTLNFHLALKLIIFYNETFYTSFYKFN